MRHDLVRVLKRLGLTSIQSHLPLILQISQTGAKSERIDIATFSANIMQEVQLRTSKYQSMKHKFIQKIHRTVKEKGYSLFDTFVRLDVTLSGGLCKVKLKTGVQALGIAITRHEFELLWAAIRRPRKVMRTSKPGDAASWGTVTLTE